MKKILFSIFAIILASGCSLKEHSFTEIEKDAYFKDAQQAQTVPPLAVLYARHR